MNKKYISIAITALMLGSVVGCAKKTENTVAQQTNATVEQKVENKELPKDLVIGQSNTQATQQNSTAAVTTTNNELKSIDSGKYISIDNVPMTAKDADSLLLAAIETQDLERIKYLLNSGVNLGMDYTGIVKLFQIHDFFDFKTNGTNFASVYEANKNGIAGIIARTEDYPIFSSPEKLKAYNAAFDKYNYQTILQYEYKIGKTTDPERIKLYKEKIDEQKKILEISKLLIDKTPDEDLIILLPYLNVSRSGEWSSIGYQFELTEYMQEQFAKRYINNIDNVKAKINANPLKKAVMDGYLNSLPAIQSGWNVNFYEVDKLWNATVAYPMIIKVANLAERYRTIKIGRGEGYKLEFKTSDFKDKLDFKEYEKYITETESESDFVEVKTKLAVLESYRKILANKNTSLVMQEAGTGKSILNAVLGRNTGFNKLAQISVNGVIANPALIRDLLEKGANPNLLDSEKNTALSSYMKYMSDSKNPEVLKAFTDKNYKSN